MTLVYARVTNEVDASYTKPTGLRSAPGGTAAMAHLAAEFDQKLLGNGHCNRPSQLDCQFESICESCAHFSTNTSFVPVLEAQRDHAAERDQHLRVDLFDMLVDRARTEQP